MSENEIPIGPSFAETHPLTAERTQQRSATPTIETLQSQIEQLTKRAEAAEADCVVMREYLMRMEPHQACCTVGVNGSQTCTCELKALLQSTSGATLLAQLKSLEERNKVMSDALDKLARLGNEPCFGNSRGNEIAIKALKVSTEGGGE